MNISILLSHDFASQLQREFFWIPAAAYYLIFPLAGLYGIYLGLTGWKRFRKIADVPTSTVRAMAVGLVEIKGKVVLIKKLKSPISGKECAYYKIERQTGSEKNGWGTIDTQEDFQNFYLRDSTGKVEVHPRLAHIDLQEKVYPGSTETERYLEYILYPGGKVYVLGTAKIKREKGIANADNLIVTKGENDPFYYISNRGEQETKQKLQKEAKDVVLFGLGLVIGMTALVIAGYLLGGRYLVN